MQIRAFSSFRFVLLSVLMLACVAVLSSSSVFAAPSPFGVAVPETTTPITSDGWWGSFQTWVLSEQSRFYLALKDAVKLVETSSAALWSLLGLSFAYGVFHAAGPGHGKVVLSTYLFASGATARRGAGLAMIAAMVQASVAVVLIGIAAIALNLTSMVITEAALMLEMASYAMFVVLGGWLLLRAWRGFQKLRASSSVMVEEVVHEPGCQHHHDHSHDHQHSHSHGEDHSCCDHSHAESHGHDHHSHSAHDHHHHTHDHDADCGCGHSHAPSLEAVEQAGSLRGAALAVVSMGLRPCSGALIVLVFALSQQVFWAGVLSAFAMGLGTGFTVASLALLAVYARGLSGKLAEASESRGLLARSVFDWAGLAVLGIAGVIVAGFGALLLLANLA